LSCLSVRCTHGAPWLPMDRFSRNLIFLYFSLICLENSNFITIGQIWRVLYKKTNIHFWWYLVHMFLNDKTKFVQKIKTHVFCSITFFSRKSVRLWDNVEKCIRAGQYADDNIAHEHCVLDNKGYKHTLRICNTYCFSTKTLAAWTLFNVTSYEHCLYLFIDTFNKTAISLIFMLLASRKNRQNNNY
jgi:hypothetical protein